MLGSEQPALRCALGRKQSYSQAMKRTLLTMFAMLLVASTACGDEERHTTPPTSEAASGSEPATPETHDEQTGPSPWGNSLPDDDVDDSQCSGASSAGPTCAANSDCGICHDGSACGRAANREEIERLGAQCRIPDAAECEYAVVRCCSGHCQVTPS